MIMTLHHKKSSGIVSFHKCVCIHCDIFIVTISFSVSCTNILGKFCEQELGFPYLKGGLPLQSAMSSKGENKGGKQF